MNGVWWCSQCQVPLLTPHCDACGRTYSKPFARDLVPVFREEMTLLRDRLGMPHLPKRSRDFYIWNSGNRYYRLGEKVAVLRYDGTTRPRVSETPTGQGHRRPRHRTALDEVPARMYLANRVHMESIEHEALEFVRETVGQYPEHVPMVTFSGGKDSALVSALVCKALGRCSVLHVMSDTTLEAPETYDYVKTFGRIFSQIPLVVVTPQVDFREVSSEIGPPSRIQRWCCTSHKAAPIASVVAALRRDRAGVLTFDGIRAAESTRRQSYARVTSKHKIRGEVLASPIQSWGDLEVWTYTLGHGLAFNQGYRYGFRRIGCLPCPFNSLWSRYLVATRYPRQDREWQSFLMDHAKRIGHPNPEHFASEGWRKRAGGRGMEHERASLMKETCLREERTFTYTLVRPWSEAFLEYIRPFGALVPNYDDGLILKATIVNRELAEMVARLRVTRPRNQIRVTFAPRKNLRLLVQRFERQLKKYQSCILCGGCMAACPADAICATGRFVVDAERCVHCLECVSAPCVAVESLTRTGKVQWRVCDGSV